ncbi:GTPase-activating protein S13 [Bonamia ostreae]|uniref:GTPase-activating protein S13 n=1 Tax=Bonamia ostreae TaxID=126728 RepID=A0ABV2AIU1_9EUKA
MVWNESSPGKWDLILRDTSFEDPVNDIKFAPVTDNIFIAAVSSGGDLFSYNYDPTENKWNKKAFPIHCLAANAISFSPENGEKGPRVVTGGSDGIVKFWEFDKTENLIEGKHTPRNEHSGSVTDVAWSPSTCGNKGTVASCSEDRTVKIWQNDSEWAVSATVELNLPVCSVSWSPLGDLLAATLTNGEVKMVQQTDNGEWNVKSSKEE